MSSEAKRNRLAERSKSRHLRVEERLDPEPVAREEERALDGVPDREGEHADQLLGAALAHLLVEMDDDLGVALRPELMSLGDQLAAEFAVVVDLAVEDDVVAAGFVAHRLAAAGEVNDAQPLVEERGRVVLVGALVVRPAMADRRAHPLGGLAVPRPDPAADSAHIDIRIRNPAATLVFSCVNWRTNLRN